MRMAASVLAMTRRCALLHAAMSARVEAGDVMRIRYAMAAACPAMVTRSPTLFRKAFHVIGNDELRWVSRTYAFQSFQATS